MILSALIHIYREDRYLLFITENYAALRTLQHFLLGDLSMEKPLILFGSRFPKENEYAKVFKLSKCSILLSW